MDKIKKSNGYDEILLNLIPNLWQYKYSHGGEGEVYFIDDNFVVKEYIGIAKEELFEAVFDKYCRECQIFAEKGYNVPKIYSWIKIDDPDRIYNNKHRYFVLEERAKGRELYNSHYDDYEKVGSKICSYEEFKEAIQNKNNSKLFEKIMIEYINDYLQINKKLEASGQKLEDLIMTIFKMYVESVYSSPDVYLRNLIIDENTNVTLIDNMFKGDEVNNGKTPVEKLYIDILKLLSSNPCFKDDEFENNTTDTLKVLEANKNITKALLLKIINIINKSVQENKIVFKNSLNEIENNIITMFGIDDGKEILSNIQIEK